MFDIQIDESGIAILEWNMVGAVNVLNQQSIQALTEVVEKVASDDAIRGAVLTSAKEGFSSGGDIGELFEFCLLYTSPSPRDGLLSRMPSSA